MASLLGGEQDLGIIVGHAADDRPVHDVRREITQSEDNRSRFEPRIEHHQHRLARRDACPERFHRAARDDGFAAAMPGRQQQVVRSKRIANVLAGEANNGGTWMPRMCLAHDAG